MLIYLTFLRKELIEILQNKKILLFLCLSLCLPLIINIIATNPPVPLELVVSLYVVIAACVVSELIKLSLVEEFKLSTFNNLLIAPFKKEYLIYYKTTIQVLVSFLTTVLGLLFSDVFLLLIPKFSYFVTMTTFFNVIVALCSSYVCGWISFYLFIRTRSVSATTHTLLLGIIMGTLAVIAMISNIYCPAIIGVCASVILLLTYVLSKITLTSPQPLKNKNSRQWFCLFKGQNLIFVSAIIIKDFAGIRISNMLEVLFYIVLIFLVKTPVLFYGILFLVATFGVRKLFYPSIIDEKLNKTSDILQIQKIKIYIYIAKVIVPTIVSMILSFSAIALYTQKISDLYFAFIVVILSPILTYTVALFVKRPKEFSIGSAILNITLLVMYLIILFMFKL